MLERHSTSDGSKISSQVVMADYTLDMCGGCTHQYAALGEGTALFRVRSSRLVKTMETKCASSVLADACIMNKSEGLHGPVCNLCDSLHV